MAKRKTKNGETGARKAEAWAGLWPGENPERAKALLQALHILTRDGQLNADAKRKLKQVLHLAQLIRPALDEALANTGEPVLADLGAGKSYLGFVLYDLVFGPAGRGRVVGVETRADLVEASRKLATECGFTRMEFVQAPIAEAQIAGNVDIVTALHACDTATDEIGRAHV